MQSRERNDHGAGIRSYLRRARRRVDAGSGRAARGRIEADLADVLAAARQNPDIPSVEVSVHAGRIADTLEHELIEPFEPNLVVCGERGLSNIKYVFVGSVSTFLIRNLRCDVLVVKQ